MVLPYLKGLIIKKHFYLFISCYYWVYLLFLIYFWVRSTTSGIRALSWAQKWRIFFIFSGFQGRRVGRSDLYILVQDIQNIIVDLDSM